MINVCHSEEHGDEESLHSDERSFGSLCSPQDDHVILSRKASAFALCLRAKNLMARRMTSKLNDKEKKHEIRIF